MVPEISENDDERGAALLAALAHVAALPAPQRRREELIERAVASERFSRESAEAVYDVAVEEGLDPMYGLELVGSGLGVCELEPPSASGDSVQQDPPGWLDLEPGGREAHAHERQLRASLRRLRHMLEQHHGDAVAAGRSLLAEPDVGACDYDVI